MSKRRRKGGGDKPSKVRDNPYFKSPRIIWLVFKKIA
jgi:hypothetical protein